MIWGNKYVVTAPRHRKPLSPKFTLHERRITQAQLAERVDLTLAKLSILKTGKAKAIRFSTLAAICRELSCQPGGLLDYQANRKEGGIKSLTPTAKGRDTIGR